MAKDVFPGAVLVQLEEWGYPKGSLRPTPPAAKAFSVLHITGNSRLPSAENEVAWRSNDPGLQNSATFFVNRDGSPVQALGDPIHMDPWANGDVNVPDRSNPRIDAMVRDGVNANERTIVAIENVGYEPGSSITPAQEKTCAAIIRYYHDKAGVPVNRQTIIGHYQLNSVTRPNCPAHDKDLLDRIVALANSEDPAVIEELRQKLAACRETVAEQTKRINWLESRRQALRELVDELQGLDAAALKAKLDEIRAIASEVK